MIFHAGKKKRFTYLIEAKKKKNNFACHSSFKHTTVKSTVDDD